MCSFLFTNKSQFDIDSVNYLIQKRGPDNTNYIVQDGFFYLHNLLSITGEITQQPIISDDIILLYNGEIYNYEEFGNYRSDGPCILDTYKTNGYSGLKLLDGEFSIFIHDKLKKRFYLCTDTFGTKPLYYSIEENSIGVCSYPTPLSKLGFKSSKRVSPNKILVIDSESLEIIDEFNLYDFILNQFKDSFNDWEQSFINSIRKRTKNINHKILVPMSSGYDSGLICLSLNQLNVDYVSYTIKGSEDQNTIKNRLLVNTNTIKEVTDRLTEEQILNIKSDFQKNVQNFTYGSSPENIMYDGFEDQGAIGLYYIIKECKEKNNTKIILSGQGSDEIMSNIQTYGFNTKNPLYFTDDLSSIFPWGNFYYGSQWSYLMKEECVAGSLGVETRYPFLDRDVVQEYIYLLPELKNKKYKSPISAYFDKYEYPYIQQKIGFQIR